MRPQHAPPNLADDLDAMGRVAAYPRVVFLDDLDLEAPDPSIQAGDLAQLPLSGLPVPVGDVGSPALEYEFHVSAPGWAPAWLTWSLAPHSPAEGVAADDGGLAPSPGRVAPPGAGLTSKPHHAQRPTVALRGSFRLRLASTTERRSPGQPQTQAEARADYSNGPERLLQGTALPSRAPREGRPPLEGFGHTRLPSLRW